MERYDDECGSNPIIPSEIDGLPVTNLDFAAFSKTQLITVTIPASIKYISNDAFYDCQLSSLNFQNSSALTYIGQRAFRYNNLSGTIVLPSNMQRILANAFDSNPNLSTIVIKKNDSTDMTLGTNWNDTASVIFDPNYEE